MTDGRVIDAPTVFRAAVGNRTMVPRQPRP